MSVPSRRGVTLRTAPKRNPIPRAFLRAYVSLLLFIALATTFWFNLIGPAGLATVVVASVIVSVVVWARERPAFEVRHLPVFLILYVGWAGVSAVWSHWLAATGATWVLLVCTTTQGIFVASVLTWRELVRATTAALAWILCLSLAFELWVALIRRAPVFPLVPTWDGDAVPELAWSRGHLFDLDERIQGIVGNAHLLGIAALLAILAFSVRLAERAAQRRELRTRRGRERLQDVWLVAGIALAAVLLWRSRSATVTLAACAAALLAITVLTVRLARSRRQRRVLSVMFALGGIAGAGASFALRGAVFDLLGKSGDMTGRAGIWDAVLARIAEHPLLGWGFATPWVPWDPAFRDWIVINGVPLFHAHNAWIDVLFQVGVAGIALLALGYTALARRAWSFAVTADRATAAFALFPILVVTILLVQGLAESRPLMEWGWMFTVLLATKLAASRPTPAPSAAPRHPVVTEDLPTPAAPRTGTTPAIP